MSAANAPKYDLVVVSDEAHVKARVSRLASEFQISILELNTTDELFDNYAESHIPFIVLSTGGLDKKEDAVGIVQVARQVLQDAFIFVAVGRKMDAKSADFIRKSGADAVVLEDELMMTSKLEFFAIQKLKAAYLPVKGADFTVNTTLSFTVLALLSQNKKFWPLVHKGFPIDAAKFKKMNDAGELYIKRHEVPDYYLYVKNHTDNSAEGLMRRCRSTYVSLGVSFADLVVHLTDQSENASFESGKENLAKCETLAAELLSALMAVGKVWEVVSQSVIGEFGSLERSPARAAYAGFLSLMGGIGKPEEMMLAALLADIGLIGLHPNVIKKIRENKMESFTADEKEAYQYHPQRGVNLVVSRKVPLSQKIKDGILGSHAQMNLKGFPDLAPEKITLEAQMIHFVQLLDDRVRVEMGKAKPDFNAELKKLVEEHKLSGQIFSISFIQAISKIPT